MAKIGELLPIDLDHPKGATFDSYPMAGLIELLSVIVEGQEPLPIEVARFCALVPANHSACVLVEPVGSVVLKVRAVAPPEQLPAVDVTVAVKTLAR